MRLSTVRRVWHPSLEDETGTWHKSQLLQGFSKEMSIKHLLGEVLQEALDLNSILLLQGGGDFKQSGVDGQCLHDVTLRRLKSQTSFSIGRSRLGLHRCLG